MEESGKTRYHDATPHARRRPSTLHVWLTRTASGGHVTCSGGPGYHCHTFLTLTYLRRALAPAANRSPSTPKARSARKQLRHPRAHRQASLKLCDSFSLPELRRPGAPPPPSVRPQRGFLLSVSRETKLHAAEKQKQRSRPLVRENMLQACVYFCHLPLELYS